MSNRVFDEIFFDTNVGLGDSLVLNGAVRYYARQCNKLYYPAMGAYFDTLTCLYQDDPNIEVWRFYEPCQQEIFVTGRNAFKLKVPPLHTTKIHRVNCEPEYVHIHWPQQIYENIDLPFSYRYTWFRMPQQIPGQDELFDRLTQGETEYALVHRFASTHPQGIPIAIEEARSRLGLPAIKIIEVQEGQTVNMLNYAKLIRNAKEIHCIASSFFNLVDSIVTEIDAVCVFHDIRRNSIMKVNSRWNNYRWQIFDYDHRI